MTIVKVTSNGWAAFNKDALDALEKSWGEVLSMYPVDGERLRGMATEWLNVITDARDEIEVRSESLENQTHIGGLKFTTNMGVTLSSETLAELEKFLTQVDHMHPVTGDATGERAKDWLESIAAGREEIEAYFESLKP